MSASTRTRIVKIGNARGVRIPKLLLEQSGLADEVEIEAQDHQLVVRSAQPKPHPRKGWAKQFRAMAERGDDRLLDADAPGGTEWAVREWEW